MLSQRVIAKALERLLGAGRIRQVHVADGTVPPPPLAYVTPFPRVSIPLDGVQSIEIARHGRSDVVSAGRGHAVLVPAHAWDRPQWSNQATVLTCLFGHKQIGFSLVQHGGKTDAPQTAIKTSVHGAHDGVSRNILQALTASAMDGQGDRLNLLLVESLLHACVRLLKHVEPHPHRKATLTYEAICLYVAEHFQNRELNREFVAERFGLAPNHISRLFAVEGSARFNDHLNIVRVNRAKFMLQNYRMSVKEIAANSGYGDAAYFCRVFRKVTGLTPLQYRIGS
ncbi:MAG: helix-turn-helix transcriptional regulator, partial [Acidobacteriota bacterium]